MHKTTAWAAIALTALALTGAAWADDTGKTTKSTTSSTDTSSKSKSSGVACSNDERVVLKELGGAAKSALASPLAGNLQQVLCGNDFVHHAKFQSCLGGDGESRAMAEPRADGLHRPPGCAVLRLPAEIRSG